MNKRSILIIIGILMLICVILLILPKLEFKTDNKITYISYSEYLDEYDLPTCYNESVIYDEKKNISITHTNYKKYFIFYLVTLDYKDGNLCDVEYLLEESYIDNFINNAQIEENEKKIDIKELIQNKKAVVSNKRYVGNDYETSIYYILDGKHEVLYVFYIDDLLVIQVGNSDEGPKFIAYK